MGKTVSRAEMIDVILKKFQVSNPISVESFENGRDGVLYFDEPIGNDGREDLGYGLTISQERLTLTAYLPFGVKPSLSSEALEMGFQAYRGNANYALELSDSYSDLNLRIFTDKLSDLRKQAFALSLDSGLFIEDENRLFRLSPWGSTIFMNKCKLISAAVKTDANNASWLTFVAANPESIKAAGDLYKSKSAPTLHEVQLISQAWLQLLTAMGVADGEYKTRNDIIFAKTKAALRSL